MEQDPVCEMYMIKVDETLKYEYKEKTYYFCCNSCKVLFEKDPEKYLKQEDQKEYKHWR